MGPGLSGLRWRLACLIATCLKEAAWSSKVGRIGLERLGRNRSKRLSRSARHGFGLNSPKQERRLQEHRLRVVGMPVAGRLSLTSSLEEHEEMLVAGRLRASLEEHEEMLVAGRR